MAETIPAAKEDITGEQILQAALVLFQKYGRRKVTMDDIARAVGKSRSSLYYYYKSRDEVFDAVMEAIIGEVVAEISRAVEKASSVKEKLRAFCLTKIKTSRDRHAFFSALEAGMDADEVTAHKREKHSLHKRLMKLEAGLLGKIFSQGMKGGELRHISSEELEMLTFILLSSVRGIRREMMLDDDYSRAVPAVKKLVSLFVKGLKD